MILFTPIHNQEEAEYHPSQMGEMCNSVTRSSQSGEQLDDSITNHKELCLDREWYRKDKHLTIRE